MESSTYGSSRCSVCRANYTIDSTGDPRCSACRSQHYGCRHWGKCDPYDPDEWPSKSVDHPVDWHAAVRFYEEHHE